MANTWPAIKGKFGSHNYYIVKMKVGDLKQVTIPKDTRQWDQMSIEVKYQRNINERRVKKDIATYFANNPDRFMGSLILAVMEAKIHFHEYKEHYTVKPNSQIIESFGAIDDNMGYVRLENGALIVPLDGQHRVQALIYAMSGKDKDGKDIAGIPDSNFNLTHDDVNVILVQYDEKQSRRIFTTVNRHAKSTTKAENIIIDDDDPIAVLTRKISDKSDGSDGLFNAEIINISNNTLKDKDTEFTTLTTLYECNKEIIAKRFHIKDPHKKIDLLQHDKNLWQNELKTVWKTLMTKIDLWRIATQDQSPDGDSYRQEIKDKLLGKPIGQRILMRAYLNLHALENFGGPDYICNQLNKIKWHLNHKQFQGIIMDGDKIKSGSTAINLTSRFIQYLCGEDLPEHGIRKLEDDIKEGLPHGNREDYHLPQPISQANGEYTPSQHYEL